MGNVFATIGRWMKLFFFAATALAIAGLNLLMLLDVFKGDILFVILGMIFFSIATWVYLATSFTAHDKLSGTQVTLSWVGLGLSLLGELTMAGFEILRMQSFIAPPPWVDTVTIMVIEAAIIIHLLLGIGFFAAGAEYNERVNRLYEESRKRSVDEKLRKSRVNAEIDIQEETVKETISLTRSMLAAARPIISERKAVMMADEAARMFGLDADPQLQAAYRQSIAEYRLGHMTRAMHPELVIDGRVSAEPIITPPPPPADIPADNVNPTKPQRGQKA